MHVPGLPQASRGGRQLGGKAHRTGEMDPFLAEQGPSLSLSNQDTHESLNTFSHHTALGWGAGSLRGKRPLRVILPLGDAWYLQEAWAGSQDPCGPVT